MVARKKKPAARAVRKKPIVKKAAVKKVAARKPQRPKGPPPVWRATMADLLPRLPTPEGRRSVTAFTHGSLEIKLYAPRGNDPQQPHDRDEIYVVMYGTGVFFNGGQRQTFRPGDLLFVPAHVEHRFEEFTDDAVIWVAFYGPRGGERA
jgi:mannose-6-phosphate isomerase-like protein (cupin superfamily)